MHALVWIEVPENLNRKKGGTCHPSTLRLHDLDELGRTHSVTDVPNGVSNTPDIFPCLSKPHSDLHPQNRWPRKWHFDKVTFSRHHPKWQFYFSPAKQQCPDWSLQGVQNAAKLVSALYKLPRKNPPYGAFFELMFQIAKLKRKKITWFFKQPWMRFQQGLSCRLFVEHRCWGLDGRPPPSILRNARRWSRR